VGEADVVIVPDSVIAQYVIFFGRLKHTPVINVVHTNVKSLLQQSVSKWNPVPYVADFFLAINTWLATVAYTTSPSYTTVLRKRGYRVAGSFSPRIKTQIFNEYDDPQTVAAARDYLTKGQPHRPVLLYVGRWSREKRIHLLAAAKPDNAIVAVVGDGPQADEINALHNEKTGFHVFQGIEDQARLRVLYKAADLLVSASDFEVRACVRARGGRVLLLGFTWAGRPRSRRQVTDERSTARVDSGVRTPLQLTQPPPPTHTHTNDPNNDANNTEHRHRSRYRPSA
jgi:glycosyltransferase involved in cell wall biosynthesis